MAEKDGRFSKARLEAFSDGVIAVIITIMVLDLKAPESAEPGALFSLWSSFSIYLISFVFVAIYWINHHYMLTAARRATASLIWANTALLFCLSLIPFTTAYVAATHMAPFPTMVYGALQFACGVAYAAAFAIIDAQRRDDTDFLDGARLRLLQNGAALAVYALATAVAAFSPFAALALFVVVAVAYVAPGLFAEMAWRKHR